MLYASFSCHHPSPPKKDYMEIGYLSSENQFSRSEVGPWKFCADADIRRIVGSILSGNGRKCCMHDVKGENKTDVKLSAMADIGRIEQKDVPPVYPPPAFLLPKQTTTAEN